VRAETRTEAEEASTNTTFRSVWVRQAERVDCRSQVAHRPHPTTKPTTRSSTAKRNIAHAHPCWLRKSQGASPHKGARSSRSLVHSRRVSRRGRHRPRQRSLALNAPDCKCSPEQNIPLSAINPAVSSGARRDLGDGLLLAPSLPFVLAARGVRRWRRADVDGGRLMS